MHFWYSEKHLRLRPDSRLLWARINCELVPYTNCSQDTVDNAMIYQWDDAVYLGEGTYWSMTAPTDFDRMLARLSDEDMEKASAVHGRIASNSKVADSDVYYGYSPLGQFVSAFLQGVLLNECT